MQLFMIRPYASVGPLAVCCEAGSAGTHGLGMYMVCDSAMLLSIHPLIHSSIHPSIHPPPNPLVQVPSIHLPSKAIESAAVGTCMGCDQCTGLSPSHNATPFMVAIPRLPCALCMCRMPLPTLQVLRAVPPVCHLPR